MRRHTQGLKTQHTMKKRSEKGRTTYGTKSKRCQKPRLKATHATKTKLGAGNTIKLAWKGYVAAAGFQSVSRFVIVAGIFEFYSQHNIYKLKRKLAHQSVSIRAKGIFFHQDCIIINVFSVKNERRHEVIKLKLYLALGKHLLDKMKWTHNLYRYQEKSN